MSTPQHPSDPSSSRLARLAFLPNLPDLPGAAAELRRVLKPGGRVLLIDEDFDDPDHAFAAMGEHGHSGPEFVDLEEMTEILRQAGLSDTSTAHEPMGNQPAFVISARKVA